MRRHLIGVIALLLILGAVGFWIWPPEGAWGIGAEAGCWRLAIVLSVLWLAYPDVRRLPAWFWLLLPALVLILVFRPRWFLAAVPLILLLAILIPRTRK
jgi:hypothetical protein